MPALGMRILAILSGALVVLVFAHLLLPAADLARVHAARPRVPAELPLPGATPPLTLPGSVEAIAADASAPRVPARIAEEEVEVESPAAFPPARFLGGARSDDDPALVHVRVLDVDGEPLANTRFSVRTRPPESAEEFMKWSYTRALVESDDEGRLRFEVEPAWAGAAGDAAFAIYPYSDDHLPDQPAPRTVRLTCAFPLASAELDFGQVRLTSLPPLFAGRVVDDRGIPVPHPRVLVILGEAPPGIAPPLFDDLLTGEGDEGGYFVIHGEIPEGIERELVAYGDGYGNAELLPVIGDRFDQLLVANRESTIRGCILPEGDAPRSLITVQVAERPDDYLTRNRVQAEADGSFEITGLCPGRYTVRGRIGTSSDNLFEVNGVDVTPGQVVSDPRLQNIELTQPLHRFELQVVDRLGEPVPDAMLWIRRVAFGGRYPVDAAGRVVLASPNPLLQIAVRAPGRRDAHFTVTAAEQTLTVGSLLPEVADASR